APCLMESPAVPVAVLPRGLPEATSGAACLVLAVSSLGLSWQKSSIAACALEAELPSSLENAAARHSNHSK
ncbi:hypothetical protein ACJBXN_10390, partial [Streptococcus suis]